MSSLSDRIPPDDPGNPSVNFHGEQRRQRDPSVDHRPRGETGQKGRGQGGQALLHRERADGEPQSES